MMETIRAAANHVAVKIIFAIIIISFIFTGVFSGGNSARDEQIYIAKVDGEGISRAQFEAQASAESSRAMGDSTFIKQIRRDVLADQINNYLAYQLSKDLNLNISDDRLKEMISKQKEFFENGKFSNQKYLNLLAANNFTPEAYAESIRAAAQRQQLISSLIYSDFVVPNDSDFSQLLDQTRTIYAAPISSSIVKMDDVNITTEDEQKYYDEHKNSFFRKERVKFKYIANAKQDYLNTITIDDKDIKKEFNDNLKEYTYPAKKSFSVIFVKDYNQAEDIVKDLSSGTEFSTVLKNINQNEDVSPYGKNGSLGWFADNDDLPQPFKEANLHNIGEVSKPIQVEGGYVIVKLDDLQKAKSMDYDYAKYQIKTKLQENKIQQHFENAEDKMKSALVNHSNDFDAIAKEAGLDVKETDWTYYNDASSIARYPEVRDVIFSSDMIADDKVTGKISEIIPVGRDLDMSDFIIQVVDYKPEGIAPFEEVKNEIHQKLYDDIVDSRFKSTVDDIVKELNEKGTSKQVQFSTNYTLKRDSNELDRKVVDMVFNLVPSATDKRVYGVEYINKHDAYITVLTQVKDGEWQDVSSYLLRYYLQNTYNSLATDMRSRAKIEIMPNSNL